MKRINLFCILIACIMCLLFTFTGCNTNTDNTGNTGSIGNTSNTGSTDSTDNPNSDNDEDITASLTFEQKGNGYVVTGASGQEERIIIPNEHEGLPVTEIGESAFAYSKHTSNITYVSIPDSVTVIGLNAFHNRSKLITVDIGVTSSLVSIGRNAFSGNGSLKTIYIPQGVKEIGDSAFNNCGALESFTVASENTAYRAENGHLIERATNTLIRGVANSNIPESVTSIAQAAFRKSNGITELNIPKSLEKIGNYFIADSTITKINYAGTEAEWNAIEKSATMWNYGNSNVQVAYSSASNTPVILSEIYMTFNGETITAQVYDNATARDLLSRLPLTLSFTDYNNTEKIAYLPNGSSALNTSDAPETFTPSAGDITVYAPWGNIAIFYNSFSASAGLVPFGKISSEGIAKLSKISDNTNITITREKPTTPEQPTDEPKVLIAYFSCTNTTKGVAEAIHSQVSGSDIYQIVPAVPYTSADLNYNTDCRANREQNDPTARPKISGSLPNIEQYDVIFIGYPIWWGQAPKIIYTFFESYNFDFDGVTIIPFCTSGSSGIGSSATNLRNLAAKANWKSGARVSGDNVSSLIAQMN